MINNLDELGSYLKLLGEVFEDSIHRNGYDMYLPGINNEEARLIQEKFQGISEKYIEVARKYKLLGLTIGYFVCSPDILCKTLIKELTEANIQDSFFPKEFMEKHRMYQIGSYNTDLVCVTAGTGQFKEGEILFVEEGYDIYNPQDDQIHPLAKDFEQFLIVAGNFDEIHCATIEDNSNWEEKKNEFIERLRLLGVDENYHKAWINVS